MFNLDHHTQILGFANGFVQHAGAVTVIVIPVVIASLTFARISLPATRVVDVVGKVLVIGINSAIN